MIERQLQRATAELVAWAKRDGVIAFHPANERSNQRERMRLSSEGVLPGVADWVFLADGRGYVIELKTARGRLSKDQQQFERDCKAAGIPHAVCRSLDEFAAVLQRWGLMRAGWQVA